MTAEQLIILRQFISHCRENESSHPAMMPVADSMMHALEEIDAQYDQLARLTEQTRQLWPNYAAREAEITRLNKTLEKACQNQRVLADGLSAAVRQTIGDRSNAGDLLALDAALKLLDDSDGARLTPATGKGAA